MKRALTLAATFAFCFAAGATFTDHPVQGLLLLAIGGGLLWASFRPPSGPGSRTPTQS